MGLQRRAVDNGGDNKDFDPIPNLAEGDYESRLVYVADLGMQEGMVWKGEQKPPAQQVALGFEIVGERVDLDGVDTARILWLQPFNIFRSLTEKGKELRYYSLFDSKVGDGDEADWESQLGKPCSISVGNVNGKGENSERVFNNISAVNKIPAKYQADVAEATVEVGIGNADEDDEDNHVNAALFGLAKWVFDKRIKDEPAKVADEKPPAGDDFDSDIPF